MAKAKVKAKKKKCKAGWQCGKGCISRKKTCRKNLKDAQGKAIAQTYANYVASLSSTPKEQPKTGKVGGKTWRDVPDEPSKKDVYRQRTINMLEEDDMYGVTYKVGNNKVEAFVNGNSFGSGENVVDAFGRNTNLNEIMEANNLTAADVTDTMYNVNFYVNNQFDADGVYPTPGEDKKKTALKVARAAMLASAEAVSALPNGTVLTASAWSGDSEAKAAGRNKLYKRMGFGDMSGRKDTISLAGIVIDGKLHPINFQGEKSDGNVGTADDDRAANWDD